MQSSILDVEKLEIISFHNCQKGLGVTLAEYQLGEAASCANRHILVQEISSNSQAAQDGRLRIGDRLVRINGQPIDGMQLDVAVKTLEDSIASGRATLAVSRDPALKDIFSASSADTKDCAVAPGCDVFSPVSDDGSDLSGGSHIDENVAEGSIPAEICRNAPVECKAAAGLPSSFRETIAARSPVAGLLSDSISLPSDIIYHTSDEKLTSLHAFPSQNSSIVDTGSPISWKRSSSAASGPLLKPLTDRARVKADKLELAMSFLGINLTKEQKAEIKLLVQQSDNAPHVDYGRFVEKVKSLLPSRLELLSATGEAAVRKKPSNCGDAARGSESEQPVMNVPKAVSRTGHSIGTVNGKPSVTSHQMTAYEPCHACSEKAGTRDQAEQTVDQESNSVSQLQQQVRQLEYALKSKDKLCHSAELKVSAMRKKLMLASEQCKRLQSRLELAESARQAARDAELDYEVIVSVLERELSKQKPDQEPKGESSVVLKKLAILGCQLRKAEQSRKVYEVAMDGLLSFAKVVYQTATQHTAPNVRPSEEGEAVGDGPTALESMPFARYSQNYQRLADKALNAIRSTHSLLEKQPLPFGWEEAYTKDGRLYYLNHVTEETVWHHPVTKVETN